MSFYSAAFLGNKKIFVPRWRPEFAFTDPQYITPNKWTYLYDHSPLVKTVEKYIDYNKLRPNGDPNARLIITAVNVLTAEPLIFDSSKQQITSRHILIYNRISLVLFSMGRSRKRKYMHGMVVCWAYIFDG